jgi:hypothetical protein
VPFAQQDVVYAFMEGVEFQYQREIERATAEMIAKYPGLVIDKCNFLDDATKRKIKSEFANQTKQTQIDCIDAMRNYRAKNYWQPIVNLVAMLPKSELATLAESMVNLTSLRRKVSAGIETVGGPVDVAMISRGEGLIWIKRKHYFQPELNHHFFANYYRNKQETSNATKS